MVSDGEGSDILVGWIGQNQCANGCIGDYWYIAFIFLILAGQHNMNLQ